MGWGPKRRQLYPQSEQKRCFIDLFGIERASRHKVSKDEDLRNTYIFGYIYKILDQTIKDSTYFSSINKIYETWLHPKP